MSLLSYSLLKKNQKLKLIAQKLLILSDSNIFLFHLPGLFWPYLKFLDVQSRRDHFCCALYFWNTNECLLPFGPTAALKTGSRPKDKGKTMQRRFNILNRGSQSFNLSILTTLTSCLTNANSVSLAEAILRYLHMWFLALQW